MFEFFLAQKYLIPRRYAKTATISILSIGVIALVVCLGLVFLSVTSGLEKRWTTHLIGLNAPLRIVPTSHYYSSYYYNVDQYASASSYCTKTLDEKAKSSLADPYNPAVDPEIPLYLKSKNTQENLVRNLYTILSKKFPKVIFEEYEIAGALMKLHLLGKAEFSEKFSRDIVQLSQMSYLLSYLEKSPQLFELIVPPTLNDIHRLWSLAVFSPKDLEVFCKEVRIDSARIFSNELPISLSKLPKNRSFAIEISDDHKIFLSEKAPKSPQGYLQWSNNTWNLTSKEKGLIQKLSDQNTVILKNPLFLGKIDPDVFHKASSEIFYDAKTIVQEAEIAIKIPVQHLNIVSFTLLDTKEPSRFFAKKSNTGRVTLPTKENAKGILLPKALQDSGACIGDVGNLSYSQTTLVGASEQKIPFFVAGFYDPGIFPVGTRFLIVPKDLVQTIYSTTATFIPDSTPTNGVYLWPKDQKNFLLLKSDLEKELHLAGLDLYFKVDTFHDYEFAKAIFQQFQSDKTLFSVIAILILLVACSNIVSLLILLVNDKRKEIAVLQAMGASKLAIAKIFALSGFFIGMLGALLGIGLAMLTLKFLDPIVNLLSSLQGRTAFNPLFFGEHLPNTLHTETLILLLIATPILSLLAGLIPAVKACKLHPATILKGEV